MIPRRRPFFPPLEQQRKRLVATLLDVGALAGPDDLGIWGVPIP